MLEDVVDKEAGPKPKLVTPPAPAAVGSAVRHIAPDELDAYIGGRLAGARLDLCRNHLDACEECRAALEDLRTFKASAVGVSQASSLKRELDRRQRQRQLKTATTALVAAAVVAAIGMVGWNKFGKAWVHSATTAFAHARESATVGTSTTTAPPNATEAAPPQTSNPTSIPRVAEAHTAQPAVAAPRATPVTQPRATAVASAQTVATPQFSQSRGASQAGATGSASPAVQPRGPTYTAQSVGQSRNAMAAQAQTTAPTQSMAQARSAAVTANAVGPTQPAVQSRAAAVTGGAGTAPPTGQLAAEVAAGSTSFALLGPFGDEVTDDRPEFAWQPLAGATKYSIIIVDEGLRPIAHTRLKTTTWRPKKPLRRGRSYLWQVTAILKNGTKVMATGPTSQEARIHITAPGK